METGKPSPTDTVLEVQDMTIDIGLIFPDIQKLIEKRMKERSDADLH